MSWTEPRTWITNEVLSKALLDEQVRDNLTYLKLNVALETAGELTIVSGAVTKSRSHHTIDTESDAASDDLNTILGGSEGEVLLIRPADGSRTIVLKHNTGNIWSSVFQDLSLVDADSYALLVYSGSKWSVIGGSGQVQISGTPEANDVAVFTDHDTIQGLSYAEFLAAIGVEAGADVTDATNVAAAGAVMEADTTTALMQFVIDEDDMVSNLNTKVPTQQSVKAYVDNTIGVAVSDYCFAVVWLPTDYALQYEVTTGEVAIRKETLPDSNPAVTLFNGFNVIAGDLYIWL